ncbi:MAG TPA: TraB/GumN family protein [Chitinophagales bacterium]|nr:TraB/GumN family protein [Chitinophagales bacterium]
MRKLNLTVCMVFIALLLAAQTQAPNSLLWEISGNGLKKPSYLFGTMHVSQKVAFHLGEPWYRSIDSVDVVAMEMTPETWLKDLLGSDLMGASFKYAMRMAMHNAKDLDKEKYAIGKDRQTSIATALKEDPAVINNIMYRYSASQGDFEEDSWLDMYLYQTGKKLGKQSSGLESFDESMQSIKNGSIPDEEEQDYNNIYKKYQKQFEAQQQIQAAYRNGDLNLLDSLTRKMSSKNEHKYIIVERNERFVSRMDSIMKKQSLFTGVGAAHLGGEKGMINMLRKLGYTLKPVPMGERDAERRNKLDSVLFDVPFQKYISSDSIISVDVPSEMQELFSIGMIKSEIATELINGAYYSIYRIKTYSSLVDGNTSSTWKIVDSLLYDNIPGKILEQKETLVNGYKALDISARTRKGNIIRMRIVLLPEELVVLKVSAPEERAKSFLGDRFLYSLNINTSTANGWQKFTMPDNSLSVQLPAKPVFYGFSKLASTITKTDLVAHDEKNECDYICMNIKQLPSGYFEEDTFELSSIAYKLSNANNYTEKKRTSVIFKNRKALKIQYKVNEQRNMDAMIVIQNLNYYVFAVYYNKSNPDAAKFFESVEFGLPQYKDFYPLVDTTLFFTTKTVTKPKNDITASLLKLPYGINGSKNKFNKDEVIDKSDTYSDEKNQESIEVSLFKYSKYNRFKD